MILFDSKTAFPEAKKSIKAQFTATLPVFSTYVFIWKKVNKNSAVLKKKTHCYIFEITTYPRYMFSMLNNLKCYLFVLYSKAPVVLQYTKISSYCSQRNTIRENETEFHHSIMRIEVVKKKRILFAQCRFCGRLRELQK